MKVGFDIETKGLTFRIASFQFWFENGENYFLPVDMIGLPEDEKAQNITTARKILEENEIIGHGVYFDILRARAFFPGIEINVIGCTQTLAKMLQINRYGLKELVVSQGMVPQSEIDLFKDVVGADHDSTKVHYQDKDFIRYAMHDAEWPLELEEKLLSTRRSITLTYQFEVDKINPFVSMSLSGMRIDWQAFLPFRRQFAKDVLAEKDLLNKQAGFDFRVRSSADMAQVWENMKLPLPPVRTKKGAVSYGMKSIEKVKHPFVTDLMAYSHNFSVQSTLDTLERYLPEDIGDFPHVHPTYKITGADATSRVYTQDPSANSLPKEFRNFVIPEEGYKFVFLDWSAAELILAAYWAGETWLTDLYEAGEDLHKEMSARLLDRNVEDITEEDREVSKIVTFSVLFGSEGGAAAQALNISFEEGARLVGKFWEACPNILELRMGLITKAQKTGMTTTIIGRQRKVPDIFSPVERVFKAGTRRVFNTAVQSSVADLQKMLIKRLETELKPLRGFLTTSVFDSFLLQVPIETKLEDLDKVIQANSSFEFRQKQITVTFKYDLKEGMTFLEASK